MAWTASARLKSAYVRSANRRMVNKTVGRIRGFVTNGWYPSRNGPTLRGTNRIEFHGGRGRPASTKHLPAASLKRGKPSKNTYTFHRAPTSTKRFLAAKPYMPRRKF